MKLTRNEINAVATAALSGMWPPNANFYHTFFHIPNGRAMALERHLFTNSDVRRIRGALDRVPIPANHEAMKRIKEIKAYAKQRVFTQMNRRLVKSCRLRFKPRSQQPTETNP